MPRIRALIALVLVSTLPFFAAPSRAAGASNGGLLSQPLVSYGPQYLDRVGSAARTRIPFDMGTATDFNSAGDKLAIGYRDALGVRSASGYLTVIRGSSYPVIRPGRVRWAGDGSFVAVMGYDYDHGYAIWKISSGKKAQRLTPFSDREILMDTKPGTRTVTYVLDGDLWSVSADTSARTRLTTWCNRPSPESSPQCGTAGEPMAYEAEDLDWSRAGDKLLLLYRWNNFDDGTGAESLGWHAGNAVDHLLDLPESDEFTRLHSHPMVSPDGSKIAWNMQYQVNAAGTWKYSTAVRAIAGGAISYVNGAHWAWQPCVGACRVFQGDRPPSAPLIGTASSGAPRGAVNAVARWGAPKSTGTSALKGYGIVATKYNAKGAAVRTYKTSRGPTARSLTWALPAGRYRFRVCAQNTTHLACVYSGYSRLVRSR